VCCDGVCPADKTDVDLVDELGWYRLLQGL